MLRVFAMMALVSLKALVGNETTHPLELGFEALEVCGVFVVGLHAAKWMPHDKEHK